MADKESGAEQTKTEIIGMERNVKEGLANYLKGLSNIGGRLMLTDSQLIFKAGRLNFRRSDEFIPVKEIVAVERRNTLGVVPNGFGVIMRDGNSHRFLVYGREGWINAVVKVRSKISPPKKMG
jgi:hypothetical protein